MCVGGICRAAPRRSIRASPRCVRLLSGAAAAGGRSRPAPRAAGVLPLARRAGLAARRSPAPASGCRRAACRARRSPRSCRSRCVLMSAVLVQQLRRDGLAVVARPIVARVVARRGRRWRSRRCSCRSLAGAAPLVVLVTGFLVTAALGVPLAFTLALTSLTYLLGIGGVEPDHPADQDPRRRRLVRPARDPALHPRRRADGVGRHLRAHRRSRDGDRRPRPRRARDGRGRRGDPVLGHLGIDRGGRVRDQLAARAVDAEGRLLGTRGGQRRRCRVRDGHPRAAVPDDGGARIAGEPVDRDAVSGRVRAGVHPRRRAARPDRAARAPAGTGRSAAPCRERRSGARGRAARPFRPACR